MNGDLYPHQIEAVSKLRNGNILVGGVGTGKSRTALAYYLNTESPGNLYVITTARKRDSLDWLKEAARFAIGQTPNTTVAGVITVDSWNNLAKYEDVENAFFIFDEQRLVGNGAWTKSFLRIAKRNSWILLSATPGDTWLDYIPVFLANGFYRNRTEFKDEHVIYSTYTKFPKVQRYVGVQKLVRLRNQITVEMPYQKQTVRELHTVKVPHNQELMDQVVKKRWHVYEARPLKDVAELFSVSRKVVNSDASRLEAVRSLMETHPRIIVFYNFDYELDLLREGLAQPVQTNEEESEWENESKSPTIPQISHGRTGVRLTTEESHSVTETTVQPAELNDPKKEESKCQTHTITSGTSSSNTKDETSMPERLSQNSSNSETESRSSRKITDESCQSRESPMKHYSDDQSEILSHGLKESSSKNSRSGLLTENELESRRKLSKTSQRKKTTSEQIKSSESCQDSQSLGGLRHTNSTDGNTNAIPSEEISSTFQESLINVQSAEWNGHKHEPIPDSEFWVYLVQYTAGAEAWNCIATDTIVFYSLNYSYRIFEQAQGRIDRLNTPYRILNYYILKSNSMVDVKIWDALKVKKSFNEGKSGVKL